MFLPTNLTKHFTVLLSLLLPIFQKDISGICRSGLFVSSKRISIFDVPNYDEIEKNLYLGNAKAASDLRILHQLKITHILTIDNRPLPKSITMRKNLTSLYIKANDSLEQQLMSVFPMTNAFIHEALEEGSVMVHCHHGISRSATIVIAYCMQKYNIGYEKALRYVRNKRKFILPNPGFEDQLREYYHIHFRVKNLTTFQKIQTKASKHKFKLASAAMFLACMLIPIVILL